jgi:hypothetical protein
VRRFSSGMPLVMAIFALAGCRPHPQAIAPDFEVDFSCRSGPQELVIEAFARRHGFRAFNEEEARRRAGHSFFPLEIDAFDIQRRMLDVIGLREPPSRGGAVHYRLTILSPPPTVHDQALEHAGLGLVRDGLRCRVDSARANDNGSEATAMFEGIFRDEQRRIAELEQKRRAP